MANSPYAPPAARVSDPLELRGPRPLSVRRAAQFLWASFVLSVASGMLYLAGALPTPNLTADVVTTISTAGLIALIAAKVGAGRSWARWLFVAIYVLGSMMFAVILTFTPQAFLSLPALGQVLGLVQFGLQTCALVLMFSRASRQWFNIPHATASASPV
jgi:hypothetical protein